LGEFDDDLGTKGLSTCPDKWVIKVPIMIKSERHILLYTLIEVLNGKSYANNMI
jgi:hypothetical protein